MTLVLCPKDTFLLLVVLASVMCNVVGQLRRCTLNFRFLVECFENADATPTLASLGKHITFSDTRAADYEKKGDPARADAL